MTAMLTRPATADEEAEWLRSWRERVTAALTASGTPAEAEGVIARRGQFRESALLRLLTPAGDPVGYLAVRQADDREGVVVLLDDIVIAPEYRGQGYAREAIRVAETWATGRAPQIAVGVYAFGPAIDALLRDYPIRAQNMVKVLTEKPVLRDGLSYRPIETAEYETWRAVNIEGYAQDIAGSGLATIEDARRASAAQFAEILPAGPATAQHSITLLEDAGTVVGHIWLHHSRTPGTSFVYGVEVDQSQRGKGYGRALMLAGEALALAAGDSKLQLNVFGQNAVAIGLYDSLGYRVSAQYRSRMLPDQ